VENQGIYVLILNGPDRVHLDKAGRYYRGGRQILVDETKFIFQLKKN
jgi:hypothetical protein